MSCDEAGRIICIYWRSTGVSIGRGGVFMDRGTHDLLRIYSKGVFGHGNGIGAGFKNMPLRREIYTHEHMRI